MNHPRRRQSSPRRFNKFSKLPLELQTYVWEIACPGPRLIEVYPRPRGWNCFNEVRGYTWRAYRCDCVQECNSPLIISQVCHESRRVFHQRQGSYSRCFGTYINWEIDVLYVSDRTGHLHNAEFLKAVELGGGLGKVKSFAIHEDVWYETKHKHGRARLEFKRCGPVGVVQQLGVEHLTIVGKASFFRDGSEFWAEIDEREWLWNSDTEANDSESDYDDEESNQSDREKKHGKGLSNDDIDEGKFPNLTQELISIRRTGSPRCGGSDGLHRTALDSFNRASHAAQAFQHETSPHAAVEDGEEEHGIDGEVGDSDGLASSVSSSSSVSSELSLASEDVQDRWECNGRTMYDEDLRIYKPRAFDTKFHHHRIPTRDTGLALVDFAEIPGRTLWVKGSDRSNTLESIRRGFLTDFEEVQMPHVQYNVEDDDPDLDGYVDWSAWVPPTLHIALLRRSGQSCYVKDWKNLEQDYITWKEADFAKRHTADYLQEAIKNGHYKVSEISHIGFVDSMEGYHKVAYYRCIGKKIPCTATTSSGKIFAKGNYYNTTKKLW